MDGGAGSAPASSSPELDDLLLDDPPVKIGGDGRNQTSVVSNMSRVHGLSATSPRSFSAKAVLYLLEL